MTDQTAASETAQSTTGQAFASGEGRTRHHQHHGVARL